MQEKNRIDFQVLFPQQPGRWTVNDLNLKSLGMKILEKDEILKLASLHMQTVCFKRLIKKQVSYLEVIKGNYETGLLLPNDLVTVNYIAWYTHRRGTKFSYLVRDSNFCTLDVGETYRMWESTYQRMRPIQIRIGKGGQYFKGLEEVPLIISDDGVKGRNSPYFQAVGQMTVGEKALAYVPPSLGFGPKGFAALVPGNSHLIIWICVDKRINH